MEHFDAEIPIEKATTPPSAWYTDRQVLDVERATVFRRSWQAVGRLESLARPGDYISGSLAGEPYVALRGDDDRLHAFYNVCRHHATCVAQGDGNTRELVCPYHGWTYGLDGRLLKAPRMAGVEDFQREENGLLALEIDTWGPWVFLRQESGAEAINDLLRPLDGHLRFDGLRFEKQVRYEIDCNWKVFVDNYLDGGYHVGHLHKNLASQLDLEGYRTEVTGKLSLQTCGAGSTDPSAAGADFPERLEGGAVYAFAYPNFMINRYGPMLDTNWVLPLGPRRTLTVFDYFFEPGCDADFIARSLVASDQVQREDIGICESVQRGLESSAFDVGRYAPRLELAAHHFHRMLAADLLSCGGPSS